MNNKPFVSGFTFVRNAIKFDYPVVESIKSILEIVDEMIVLAGNSEDGTRQLIENINSPKIKIYDSIWDDSLREGGKVLAVETDKAFAKISDKATWAIYLQADEVIHEKYHHTILAAMDKYKNDWHIDGLLFKYVHFYGSYDFAGDSRKWYRNEIRIIRNDKAIHSFRDAQGFRKNRMLMHVIPINAEVYHYGWVKPPEKQQEKQKNFHKLWHNDQWLNKNITQRNEFDYSKIDSIKKFIGTHPAVMKKRIAEKNWTIDISPHKKNFSITGRFLHFIERFTGWRIGEYRNYKIVS